MPSERLQQWARWGAVFLCITTALVAVVDIERQVGINGFIPKPVLLFLAIAYSSLLFVLLRPGPDPRSGRLLAALMMVSLPLDFDNLSALNLFALPFVILPGRRKSWLWAQVGIFSIQLTVGWLNLGDAAQWDRLRTVLASNPRLLISALAVGILQCAAWGGFAYFVGSLLVQLERDRRLLARANGELQGAQTMLTESARIEERLKISRELHDSVGHYLTSLGLQLEIVGNVAGTDAQRSVERARLLVRLLLAEVREAATAWRMERPEALPNAIRQLCDGTHGLEVQLDLASDLPPAIPGTTQALYRIVQEALTNSLRYSGARKFTVTLQTSGAGGFELKVADDGAGVATVIPGTGLRGMEDRIRELGGSIIFDSHVDCGFSIHVLIPPARSVAA